MSTTPTTMPVPVDLTDGDIPFGHKVAVLLAALVNVAVLGGSFALSVDTVMSTAPWAGVNPDRAWLLPLSVDGLVLASTLAVVVARLRHRDAKRLWLVLGAAVALSSLVNGAHAATYGDAPNAMTRVLGIAMVAGAPIVAAICTHLLLDIVAAVTDPDTDTQADTATDTDASGLTLRQDTDTWTPARTSGRGRDIDTDTRTEHRPVRDVPTVVSGQDTRTPRQDTETGHSDATPGHRDRTPEAETPGQDTRTPRTVRVAAATSTTSPVRADARTSWSQAIETRRPDILAMAATGQSGRAIAATLGLNKDGVGKLIAAARADGTLPPSRPLVHMSERMAT